MFFKRLSLGTRSRSNSYIDDHYNAHSPRHDSQYEKYEHDNYDDRRPESRRPSTSQHNTTNSQLPLQSPTTESKDMYARSQGPQDAYARPPTNGAGYQTTHNGLPLGDPTPAPLNTPGKVEAAPDLLTQAFNAAVRPYQEKIEMLEQQVADLQSWVDELERQRSEVHDWIDKRGLRPDVPPSIAKALDSAPTASATLNAQLDRKITIVNFDLHRLQDDLNSSISTELFAGALLKFVPEIQRLSALPLGSRYAFDLILKLGGNLNSHGGVETENPDSADRAARAAFYATLDTEMVGIVRKRCGEEGAEWSVGREVRRLEKTAAYLRTLGVEPYFPDTLEVLRREAEFREGASSMNGGSVQGGSVNGSRPMGTPPRYQ